MVTNEQDHLYSANLSHGLLCFSKQSRIELPIACPTACPKGAELGSLRYKIKKSFPLLEGFLQQSLVLQLIHLPQE